MELCFESCSEMSVRIFAFGMLTVVNLNPYSPNPGHICELAGATLFISEQQQLRLPRRKWAQQGGNSSQK